MAKQESVTAVKHALRTQCHTKPPQRVGVCGLLWKQARTRSKVAPDKKGVPEVLALKMHTFRSKILQWVHMGARLVDPREILCEMHVTQLLLYVCVCVCVCTKFRTGQLFYYGVAILKSSVTWRQRHAINVTRLVKKMFSRSFSID